jgi:hypothetical protein
MAKTLIGAIEDLGLSTNTAVNMMSTAGQLAVYQNAVSHPIGHTSKEEVALCYTVGTLVFQEYTVGKKTERYGILDMDLFNLDGLWNGRYLTLWQPLLPPGDDLSKVPVAEYTGPWDKWDKTIPPEHLRANSNAAYEFHGHGGTGKGTIYATGPANLLLTKVQGGGAVFQVSVAAYITGGTGDFDEVRGTNTALGSSYVPAGIDIFSAPLGMPIPGVTISTFRFVRKKNQA